MKGTGTYTKEDFKGLSKDALILLLMQYAESLSDSRRQNEELLAEVKKLNENISLLRQNTFSRKSAKNEVFDGQLCFDLGNGTVLNEAEAYLADGAPEEPSIDEIAVKAFRRKRPKGKLTEDISGLPVEIIRHDLTEEELKERFPDGYTALPDEVYHELHVEPAVYTVREVHIGCYAGKKDKTVIKAPRPARMLNHSVATPSVAAAVMNAKYVNAIPLSRFSEEMERQRDVRISRQTLAHWMIKISELYFSRIYERMRDTLLRSRLIHCDETPFKVVHDGRSPNAKSYMWVYHATEQYGVPPVCLYDYQKTRRADHPREFLKGYKGILVTDGYQVYHTLQREHPEDLRVAGCWAHAKRRFADICKSQEADGGPMTVAQEANARIAAFYHIDNMTKGKSAEERLKVRQTSIKPLVDAFFLWAKDVLAKIDPSSATGRALKYCIGQEDYLRCFIDDPVIPLDNNDAERSIRKFVVGRKNWVIVDTIKGAKASAVLYSIAESAKANGLRTYEYFRYVLEEMPGHLADGNDDYIDLLLPWSDALPAACRKQN